MINTRALKPARIKHGDFGWRLDHRFNFGKHQGNTVDQVLEDDPGYILWAADRIHWFKPKKETLARAHTNCIRQLRHERNKLGKSNSRGLVQPQTHHRKTVRRNNGRDAWDSSPYEYDWDSGPYGDEWHPDYMEFW